MAKGKLKLLAKESSLMDISIRYGKEKIRFNLYEELIVNENRVNDEIKNQPSHFGFLSLLLVKLKKVMSEKKAELERIEKDLFLSFKEEIDSTTGRVHSNDVAEALVLQENDYREALKEYLQSEENYLMINAAVEAFNQRSYLIQTISANIRKTN